MDPSRKIHLFTATAVIYLISDLPSITLRPETNKWRLLTVILYYNGGKKQWENGWLSLPMIMATMEFDLKRWFWSFPSLFPRPA
jgi:hypothetical protein